MKLEVRFVKTMNAGFFCLHEGKRFDCTFLGTKSKSITIRTRLSAIKDSMQYSFKSHLFKFLELEIFREKFTGS